MAVYKDNATGTWRVIYRFTNWKGERKQTQKRGFATKREAQAWEHEVMLKQGAKLDMTFASFFEVYEADKKQRVKESTWESKSHVIRTKILPYFGNRKIAEIEAKDIIASQIADLNITEPKNLEEQALSLVGKDVYEKLIKGYTEKQWGRDCKDLPSFIIKRLPLRFIYDNNYFNDRYQGIPIGGYTKIVEKMLDGIEVRLNTNYLDNREEFDAMADKIVYTGMIDQFYDYKLGVLEYRSVRFETEELPMENYQGNAVVNYTEREVPYTRIIEHKHFEFGKQPTTIISREYSSEWKKGDEPYYPVNNDKNNALYQQYKELADKEHKVIFGGRLGGYKYYDMDKVIAAALEMCEKEL